MTTSFNLKERGILKTTSDPPPTPGILNHPPNTHPPKAKSLSSLNLSVTSSPSWRRRGLISIVLNPNPSNMHRFQSKAEKRHDAKQGRWRHLWVSENKCHIKTIQMHDDVCTYFMHFVFEYKRVWNFWGIHLKIISAYLIFSSYPFIRGEKHSNKGVSLHWAMSQLWSPFTGGLSPLLH